MSTILEDSAQADRSQNADAPSPAYQGSIPTAPAWRIGRGLVAIRCPLCGGRHIHGVPHSSEFETATSNCPDEFRDDSLPDEYRIALKAGPPPHDIAESLRRDYPLGNLPLAYRAIEQGNSCSYTRLARGDHEPDDIPWIPGGPDIRFALSVLARCGAMDEAAALRSELAGKDGQVLWRLAAADAWRRWPGRTRRERLLEAIRQCWRQCGGPV